MMTGRQRVNAIFNRKTSDRCGFWLGKPTDGAELLYRKHFGISAGSVGIDKDIGKVSSYHMDEGDVTLAAMLNSDLMWIAPDLDPNTYKHPEGKPIFDTYGGKSAASHGTPGVFAESEDLSDIENFDWPNPDYLDFSNTEDLINKSISEGMAVFCSSWGHFFHIACRFFGMEEYFIKMHTSPKVVQAVTERIVDFQLECNKRIFESFSGKLDCVFFGNDLGSQISTLIGLQQFEEFILPYMKKIIDQAKKYNLKTALHSCGAIAEFLPLMIDAGIDAIHPLQAKAVGMDAISLAREYKDDLIFIGGVDTQELLPLGTPEQVKDEVRRLVDILSPGYIVSPSHEAILPNVPIDNILAMREAVLEMTRA